MTNADSIIVNARMSDLDSQRHINNASYLNFASEARFILMKRRGFDFQYLLDNRVRIKPEYIYVKYFRQQVAQVPLRIESAAVSFDGSLMWHQDIFNANNGELACSFQSLWQVSDEKILDLFSKEKKALHLYLVPDFGGGCQRSRLEYKIRHIDLNGFNECSQEVLWRLNEEARWNFMRETGIPFENLLHKDISLFWLEGAYRYETEPQLGDTVEIYTWINRQDRARIYINQEIVCAGRRVLITEGEFVTVSLSRLKPLRTPEFLVEPLLPYTENRKNP